MGLRVALLNLISSENTLLFFPLGRITIAFIVAFSFNSNGVSYLLLLTEGSVQSNV